jgi:hypothetical protein
MERSRTLKSAEVSGLFCLFLILSWIGAGFASFGKRLVGLCNRHSISMASIGGRIRAKQ